MGTNIMDLCDVVGGMSPGDEIMLCAVDGYHIEFGYDNIYRPLDRQGPIVLCWYRADDGAASYGTGYPGKDTYSDAMQVVFFAQTVNSEGKHVFGNTDMLACFPDEKYQHFFNGLPSTNGLSGKWIDEIRIYPKEVKPVIDTQNGDVISRQTSNSIPILPIALGSTGLIALAAACYLFLMRKRRVEY
jgi:hypothetical protein